MGIECMLDFRYITRTQTCPYVRPPGGAHNFFFSLLIFLLILGEIVPLHVTSAHVLGYF